MSNIKFVVGVVNVLRSDLKALNSKPTSERDSLEYLAYSMACDHLEEGQATAEDVLQAARAADRRWWRIPVEKRSAGSDLRPAIGLLHDLADALRQRLQGRDIRDAYDLPF